MYIIEAAFVPFTKFSFYITVDVQLSSKIYDYKTKDLGSNTVESCSFFHINVT